MTQPPGGSDQVPSPSRCKHTKVQQFQHRTWCRHAAAALRPFERLVAPDAAEREGASVVAVVAEGLVNTNYVEQAQQATEAQVTPQHPLLKDLGHKGLTVLEARNSRSKQVTALLTKPGHVAPTGVNTLPRCSQIKTSWGECQAAAAP